MDNIQDIFAIGPGMKITFESVSVPNATKSSPATKFFYYAQNLINTFDKFNNGNISRQSCVAECDRIKYFSDLEMHISKPGEDRYDYAYSLGKLLGKYTRILDRNGSKEAIENVMFGYSPIVPYKGEESTDYNGLMKSIITSYPDMIIKNSYVGYREDEAPDDYIERLGSVDCPPIAKLYYGTAFAKNNPHCKNLWDNYRRTISGIFNNSMNVATTENIEWSSSAIESVSSIIDSGISYEKSFEEFSEEMDLLSINLCESYGDNINTYEEHIEERRRMENLAEKNTALILKDIPQIDDECPLYNIDLLRSELYKMRHISTSIYADSYLIDILGSHKINEYNYIDSFMIVEVDNKYLLTPFIDRANDNKIRILCLNREDGIEIIDDIDDLE